MAQLKNPSQYSAKKNYYDSNWRKYTLFQVIWTNLNVFSLLQLLIALLVNSELSFSKIKIVIFFKLIKNCHIPDGHILKIFKIIVMFKLSYKNMTIFVNCHIYIKNVIFTKYDNKKKTNDPHPSQLPPQRMTSFLDNP